jgi:hypothetical protein
MSRISRLPQEQKLKLWQSLYQIADRNKQLFFSKDWQQKIFNEFVTNFKQATNITEQHKTGHHWLKFREKWRACPDLYRGTDPVILKSMDHQEEIEQLLNKL